MSILPQDEADQASRAGYKSRVLCVAPGAVPQRAGEVNPVWFKLTSLLGICSRKDSQGFQDGCWLNCRFDYLKPQGGYTLEAACAFDSRAQFTGQSYIRSCSCPDAARRASDGAVGALRHCKHMVGLASRISRSVCQPAPIMGLPTQIFAKTGKRPSEAQRLAGGWKSGQWDPACGWDREYDQAA